MADNKNIITPKGELQWVVISGKGKENYDGDGYEYTASVILTEDEADEFQQLVDDFYAECGGQEEATPNQIIREDKDGNLLVSFKTRTQFEDGKQTVVKLVDANNNKVQLPEDIGIGNGSIGKISGVMSYFKRKKNDGVSLFLNAIKINKLVKFESHSGFEDDDDNDGDFTGFEESTGFEKPEEKPTRRSRSRRGSSDDEDEKPTRTPRRNRH